MSAVRVELFHKEALEPFRKIQQPMKIGQELFLSLTRADGISCRWVLLEVSRIQVPILSHDILKKETSNRRYDCQSVFSR